MACVLEAVDSMMHPHRIGFAPHIYVPESLGAIFNKKMHNHTLYGQKTDVSGRVAYTIL
jgi:hypothetical protein